MSSRQKEFWLALGVSLAVYSLPEQFHTFLWRWTKFALYGFGVGIISFVTVNLFKSRRKEVVVVWPESWTASNTKVIKYVVDESPYITCQILRDREPVTYDLSWQNGELQVIFPAKQAGEYRISFSYNGREVRHSPWVRWICPGPPDPEQSEVTGPWAAGTTLVMTPGQLTQSQLKLKDAYKNLIHTSRSDCSDVRIEISNSSMNLNEVETQVESRSSEISLSARFILSGVYTINVLYKDHRLCSVQIIVCLPDQYSDIHNKSTQLDLVQLLGETYEKPKAVHVYLTNKTLSIKEYMMKVIPWTLVTHRISPRLSLSLDSKCSELVVINESFPNSRCVLRGPHVLGLAAGYYTCLEKRMGGAASSLEEKKEHFTKMIRDYHNNSYLQLLGNVDYLRNSKVYLKIKRHDIYDSTLKSVRSLSKTDWLKLFVIKFEGEDGLDQGGLRREWMDLFSKFIFNPENRIFMSVEAGGNGVQPNPYPPKHVKTDHYKLIGKLLGKCLYESCFGRTYRLNLQGQLSKSTLTQMLGSDILYTHLSVDAPELYKSKIKYILDNNVDDLQLTFTQEEETSPGVRKSLDLCSKGSHKLVNEKNKQEYIYRLARFLLVERVSKQTDALLEGLHSIIPVEILEMFEEGELELLLHGIREYNVEDLKLNFTTVGYESYRFLTVLSWFWMALSHFSKEDMAKFVQFVTGSSVLPPGGWKELSPKFQIGFTGESGRLPLSYTCSNYILLPNASSYQELERVLLLAVREGVDRFIIGS